MIKKLLFFTSILCIPTGIYAQGSFLENIKQGQEVAEFLPADGEHSYKLKLDSSRFVLGKVNQNSVDVVVNIYNPEGENVAHVDGPSRGPEIFQFNTKKAGDYIIKIIPFKEAKGNYSIKITRLEPLATEPVEIVDQLMAQYSGNDTPGAAVMVMKDSEIIFSEGYGMANLSYDIPFTIQTPTNIGSTSKQFTAFAIELLAKQGKLSLDDDIRKYFPELPEFDHKVTIRNLLTHTSGYREFINTLAITGRNMDAPLDRKAILKVIKNQPELQNEPGTQWNYNNTGYAILAALVERITEVPFPQWMKTNVFDPLGMEHSIVRKNQFEVIEGRAAGYNLDEDGVYQEVQDLAGAMGAGGIYTTSGNLAKWIGNFNDPKVGSEEIISEMTTPFVLKSGDTTQYGLGLFIADYRGLKQIQHAGADIAHRSMLMYFPEIDAAVVTQSNNAGFEGNIAYKVADAFFSEHMEPEKEEKSNEEESGTYNYNVEDFDGLTGRYELIEAPGFVLNFSKDGERIYTQATGQGEVDMYAVSDSIFKLKGVNAEINFHIKEDGTADSLTLNQNGKHLAKKISWKPQPEELKEYTGKYYSDEIETIYSINIEDEKLMLHNYQIAGPMPLNPADKDSFGSTFPISDLSFVRNEQGEISGFKASNGRTIGVFFRKMAGNE
ncbi:serine hydrolase [Autumnicola musiva]|uniref:Serine hydrolase n=1 Tax=Autumnicola musiva TaxID=3075589 RepID=A0ABU3D7L1_9FLAO|nr:serine hydrolase [Zunongwangia sp. F117]MDT0677519.1 serine hydrolase [Zunongwangia sp. F117]